MGKEIRISMRPSKKYDGMKYRVKDMVQGLQTDADKRKSMMMVYEDIKCFQDCIDILTEQIWLCFVDENSYRYHPSMVVIGFAWYYGLKEGIFAKEETYDQVVYFIRRKVVMRLLEVQEAFMGKCQLPTVEEIIDRV